jgi:pyruvate dehydrogenase E1 component subunit alpha
MSSPSKLRRGASAGRSAAVAGRHSSNGWTYRFRAHSMFDPLLYRDRAEIEDWKHRDPIDRLALWMRETGVLHDCDVTAIEAQIAAEVEHSVAFAENGHWEPVADLARDVYAGEGAP